MHFIIPYICMTSWLAGCMRSTCMYTHGRVQVHVDCCVVTSYIRSGQTASHKANATNYCCNVCVWSFVSGKRRKREKKYKVGGAQRRPAILCRWRQAMAILTYTRAKRSVLRFTSARSPKQGTYKSTDGFLWSKSLSFGIQVARRLTGRRFCFFFFTP